MSEKNEKLDDSKSSPKIVKKFRKGDLVKVEREKLLSLFYRKEANS